MLFYTIVGCGFAYKLGMALHAFYVAVDTGMQNGFHLTPTYSRFPDVEGFHNSRWYTRVCYSYHYYTKIMIKNDSRSSPEFRLKENVISESTFKE